MIPPCSAVAALALSLRPSPSCLDLDLRLAGRLGLTRPQTGPSPEFTLPWARLGLGLTQGPLLGGRVAVDAARTGSSSGAIGVDGESIVARLLLAELQVGTPDQRLRGAIGLVEDPWVATGEARWGLRGVAPSLSVDQGWSEPSDLGAQLAWRHPAWSVLAGVSSGEGYRYRERDDAKDLSLLVGLSPLALGDAERAELLQLEVYGRLGTMGLDSAPTRRLGGRVSGGPERARGGLELDLVRGVDGDPERTPRGAALWAVGRPGPALVYGRVDLGTEIPGEAESRTLTLHGGAGWTLPELPEAALVLGAEHHRLGPQATAVAGSAALQTETTVYLQLHARLSGALALERLGGP